MKIGSLADVVPALLFAAVLGPALFIWIYVQRLTSYSLCRKIPLSSARIEESPESDRFVVTVDSISSEFSSKQMDRAKADDRFVYLLWGKLYLNSGSEVKEQLPFAFVGLAAFGVFGILFGIRAFRNKSESRSRANSE